MEDAARPCVGRSIRARSDDEGEVADLALDPDDGRRRPQREPDLLGKGRSAASAQLSDRPGGLEKTPGLPGIRLESLEARARIRQPAGERREIVRPSGREQEAREVGCRAREAARDVFGDARSPDALGEREPGHGFFPLPDERLARQRKTGPESAGERAFAQLGERRRRIGGQVAQDAAKRLAVVDANRSPEVRVEWRPEGDALRRGAGTPRKPLRRLTKKNLGERIRRAFRPEAGGAPREERSRERKTRVVGGEIAAHDDEIPAAFGAICKEGVGRKSRDEERGDHLDVPLAMRLPISGERTSAVRFGITMTCTLSPSFSASVLLTQVGFSWMSSTSRLRFSNCARDV